MRPSPRRTAPPQRQVNDVQFEGLSKAAFLHCTELVERLVRSSDLADGRDEARSAMARRPGRLA